MLSSCTNRTLSWSFPRASLSSNFLTPSVAGSVSGQKLRPDSLNPYSSSHSGSHPKRGVVTMVIPFSRGSAWEQPPPDLASYLYKNRIVYLGMSLVSSVTELILAEFLYLQYEDEENPIYLYINSSGTTKPIARFQGQATDMDLARREVKNVRAELVKHYSKHIGKSPEEIEAEIMHPKYFSPSEAVEYRIINKVLYDERGHEDRGVVADLKKAQLI
ncbi:hypothetical protein LOK49_LG11G02268 [Camellia lanceoleosa]|uniref:Uncharacterized protein n=1 Tax=Camellia lanceoleosa TaxID=1840588 RepID=A0ACC0G154_9ERIC|nr:hypothetical protein LOK49_LG11G02268 [Camellia lanceoleosa]